MLGQQDRVELLLRDRKERLFILVHLDFPDDFSFSNLCAPAFRLDHLDRRNPSSFVTSSSPSVSTAKSKSSDH